MATIMFPDKSGNDIQVIYLPLLRDLSNLDNYSWGSAVLATLYRNLCRASNVKSKDIGGPLVLLQLWAWERISIGRPTLTRPVNATHHGPNPLGSQHQIRIDSLGRRWASVIRKRPKGVTTLIGYRDAFDSMRHDQFTWQPYTRQILSFLPPFCYDDSDDWTVMAPMICFDIVEWHFPNRVARQFGWKQIIPLNSDTEPKLHKVDKRGASSRNWIEKHQPYIANWVRRGDFRFRGEEDDIEMNYFDPYMVWYRDRTNLRLNPFPPQATYQAPFGATEYLVSTL
ncbi:serine/threonine-protein phosphatase 7 long form homolog [Silene latifolia]|uniref:serine/threonine-protein phosphatase 7 long form homolog n=1 Tax=Silene latifolia TaxID=37657 RepID=UPI003D78704F